MEDITMNNQHKVKSTVQNDTTPTINHLDSSCKVNLIDGRLPVGVDLAPRGGPVIYYYDPKTGHSVTKKISHSKLVSLLYMGIEGYKIHLVTECCGGSQAIHRLAIAAGCGSSQIQAGHIAARRGNRCNKTDEIDARACHGAAFDPDAPLCPVRSRREQIMKFFTNARELVVNAKSRFIQSMEALYVEMTGTSHIGNVNQALDLLIEQLKADRDPEAFLLENLVRYYQDNIKQLAEEEHEIDVNIGRFERGLSSKLGQATQQEREIFTEALKIDGAGDIAVFTLYSCMYSVQNYSSSAQFVMMAGLAPGVSGSGGHNTILDTKNKGNAALKRVLFECGMSVYKQVKSEMNPLKDMGPYKDTWLGNLVAKGHAGRSAMAIGRKIASIYFNLAKYGQKYNQSLTTLALKHPAKAA